jgi:hypothetical protein
MNLQLSKNKQAVSGLISIYFPDRKTMFPFNNKLTFRESLLPVRAITTQNLLDKVGDKFCRFITK